MLLAYAAEHLQSNFGLIRELCSRIAKLAAFASAY
jgi:hypothetical protein